MLVKFEHNGIVRTIQNFDWQSVNAILEDVSVTEQKKCLMLNYINLKTIIFSFQKKKKKNRLVLHVYQG